MEMVELEFEKGRGDWITWILFLKIFFINICKNFKYVLVLLRC